MPGARIRYLEACETTEHEILRDRMKQLIEYQEDYLFQILPQKARDELEKDDHWQELRSDMNETNEEFYGEAEDLYDKANTHDEKVKNLAEKIKTFNTICEQHELQDMPEFYWAYRELKEAVESFNE